MPSFLGHPRAKTIQLPTPVYATWNPAGTNANITLSNGNLTAELTGTPPSTAYGTSAGPSDNFDNGKRYVEFRIDNIAGSSSGIAVGLSDTGQTPGLELGDLQYAYAWRADGYKESNGNAVGLGVSAVAGDVIRMAIDAYSYNGQDLVDIWFGLNGSWFGGGDPANGTGAAFVGASAPIATDWTIRATLKSVGDRITASFGANSFMYSVPIGFVPGWGNNL